MFTPTLQQRNQAWWNNNIQSELRRYPKQFAGRKISDHRDEWFILQRLACVGVDVAFILLVGEREPEAFEMLDLAIEAAHETLRVESFEPSRAPSPTPQHVLEAKTCGRMMTLKALHYAIWFRTGTRPMELWDEVIAAHLEYEKATIVSLADDLINDYVEAGRYDEALSLFRSKFVDDLEQEQAERATEVLLTRRELPKQLRFTRNPTRVMAVLAEYAAGNQALKPVAQAGVEIWYNRCLNWVLPQVSTYYQVRLRWAYLHGKHFSGVTELKTMLHELRGY